MIDRYGSYYQYSDIFWQSFLPIIQRVEKLVIRDVKIYQ